MRARAQRYWIGAAAIVVSIVVFVVPFAFIVLTALKDRKEASLREFSLAGERLPSLGQPRRRSIETRDYMLVTAFINSIILTVASVIAARGLRRDGRLRPAAPAVALDAARRTSWCSPG